MNHAAIFFRSQIRIGESIDEERNQESCRKEESPSEEKEVARQHQQQCERPWQRGLFFLAPTSSRTSGPRCSQCPRRKSHPSDSLLHNALRRTHRAPCPI